MIIAWRLHSFITDLPVLRRTIMTEEQQTRPGPKIMDEGIYFEPNDDVDVSISNVFISDSKTQTLTYQNDVRTFMKT